MKTFLNNNAQAIAGITMATILLITFAVMIAENGFKNF